MTSRWSRDQISTLIMVSQHVAYIDDHGPSASEDIGGNLICHATSQDHLIEGVIRIYGWELLVVCHNPGKFGDHRHCDNGINVFNLLHDRMIKGSCEFVGGSPSLLSHHLITFGGHWFVTLLVGDPGGKSPHCLVW